jgi:hypothetical protein
MGLEPLQETLTYCYCIYICLAETNSSVRYTQVYIRRDTKSKTFNYGAIAKCHCYLCSGPTHVSSFHFPRNLHYTKWKCSRYFLSALSYEN